MLKEGAISHPDRILLVDANSPGTSSRGCLFDYAASFNAGRCSDFNVASHSCQLSLSNSTLFALNSLHIARPSMFNAPYSMSSKFHNSTFLARSPNPSFYLGKYSTLCRIAGLPNAKLVSQNSSHKQHRIYWVCRLSCVRNVMHS